MAQAKSASLQSVPWRWIVEWRRWWRTLAPSEKIAPAAFVALYWSVLASIRGFRSDHITIGAAILGLSYLGRTFLMLRRFWLPYIATAVIYDSMRFYGDYLRGPIHVAEPYFFDKHFFGIHTPLGILTPNEWLQLHTSPVLDFVTGGMYLVFISAFIALTAYFYFWISRKGTSKRSPADVAKLATRMNWSFFWVNMLGYSTYYWYAAAPPWFVSDYGLVAARPDVTAHLAGCERFDQLLGTHIFEQMYGRAADVYGAIPSLHVAYPFLAVYFAFRIGTARIFSLAFWGLMFFSAVYLNHHYVLDALWGTVYAVIIGVAMDLCLQREAIR
ncbi:MAG: phosphatase PAP2 family protein [Bdellovibrionota bacterium]